MSPTSYHQTVPKTQSDVGALSRARTIALLKAADGLTYSDPTSYANMLNSQFSSIFNSNETNDSIKRWEIKSTQKNLPSILQKEAY